MNKYQKALDIVNERFDYMNEELHPNKHYLKPQFSLDALQELIDNYTAILRIMRRILIFNGRPIKDTTKRECYDALENIQAITRSNSYEQI